VDPQAATSPSGTVPDYRVRANSFDVVLLQSHVILVGIWAAAVTATAFLVVPRLRRALSPRALRALEVRLGTVISGMFLGLVGTIFTGLALLSGRTAYRAPYSPTTWSNVTSLPYAESYFSLLYGKLIVFAVMVAASIILVIEAVAPQSSTRPRTPTSVTSACAVILLVGIAAIGAVVPVLKYLHELIETLRAETAGQSAG
jgi:hypothetical protein